MSNSAYTVFKNGLLTGAVDLDTAVIKVGLFRNYTFSAAHASIADILASGAAMNGSATLTGVTCVGGVFDADDAVITTVSNNTNHYPIIFQASALTGGADVATSAQIPLIFYDTGTGIPVAPGNGTFSLTWPNTGNKILKVG